MEYFVGSLVTAILMLIAIKLLPKQVSEFKGAKAKYSQSYIFNIVKPYVQLNNLINKPVKDSQSKKFEQSMHIRVVFTSTEAYWIKDNKFYVADVEDGEIQNETTRIVDIMGMDKVELDRMVTIVDKLTEGLSNDHSDSGK